MAPPDPQERRGQLKRREVQMAKDTSEEPKAPTPVDRWREQQAGKDLPTGQRRHLPPR